MGLLKSLLGRAQATPATAQGAAEMAPLSTQAGPPPDDGAWMRRLAVASERERIAAALAAPYRESYLDELATATRERRPPVHLFCAGLPPQGISNMAALLKRDYDVTDGPSAEAVAADFLEMGEEAAEKREIVFCLTQAAHVAVAAAGTGYLPLGAALCHADAAGAQLSAICHDWSDYGQAFLASEGASPHSNDFNRRYLAGVVSRLLEDERSPWRQLPWPQPTDTRRGGAAHA